MALLLENQLFLSKAVSNNNEPLKPVFEFFKENLYVDILNNGYDELQIKTLARLISENQKYLNLINEVISLIDVGLVGISIEDAKLPDGLLTFDDKVKDEDKKRLKA